MFFSDFFFNLQILSLFSVRTLFSETLQNTITVRLPYRNRLTSSSERARAF